MFDRTDSKKDLKHGSVLRIVSILLIVSGVFQVAMIALVLSIASGSFVDPDIVNRVTLEITRSKELLTAMYIVDGIQAILFAICGIYGIRVSMGKGRAHTCEILAIVLLGLTAVEILLSRYVVGIEGTQLLDVAMDLLLPILFGLAARSEAKSTFWQRVEDARQSMAEVVERSSEDAIFNCSVEAIDDVVTGTLAIPQQKFPTWVKSGPVEGAKEYSTARFTFAEGCLEVESDDEQFLGLYEEYLQSRLREKLVSDGGFTAGTDLYGLLRYIMRNDAQLLVEWRDGLTMMENLIGESATDVPKDFDQRVANARNALNSLRRFYKQLKNVCDSVAYAAESELGEADRRRLKNLAERADQLASEVGESIEYAMQIRSMYQARINSRQTEITTVLTIVATICMSVSLITGWFGMNLESMPERYSSTAYFGMILACIAIVTVELVYFKRKKWF